MPSGEISTSAIVHDAFNKGKSVYVPYIYQLDTTSAQGPPSAMEMLALHSVNDFESLQPDKWGIPSLDANTVATRQNSLGGCGLPAARSAEGQDNFGLDLIVMPGLAFDENLRRLGHGKGYYDNFLMRYRRNVQVDEQRASRKPYLGEDVPQKILCPCSQANRYWSVALALEEQLLPPDEKIPVTDYDWPVDALIVGNGRFLKPGR